MEKFSITKLEEARRNPQQFAKSLTDTATKPVFRRSKFTYWQDAAILYHEHTNENTAIRQLTSALQTKYVQSKKNDQTIEDFVTKLQSYIIGCNKKGFVLSERRRKVRIQLHPELQMTGQIPVIYMNNKGGYSVCFFQQEAIDWAGELKFPIIQYYIATEVLGCAPKQVEVGIYILSDSSFELKTFSTKEINQARKELSDLGIEIYGYM